DRGWTVDFRAVSELSVGAGTPAVHRAGGERAAVIAAERDIGDGLTGKCARHIDRDGLVSLRGAVIAELAIGTPAPAVDRAVGDGTGMKLARSDRGDRLLG